MTLSFKNEKGSAAVLGTARDSFILAALGELDAKGYSVHAIVRKERVEKIEKSGLPTHSFNGDISKFCFSLLSALRQIKPDLIVVVVGDQFQHMNVMRTLDFWKRLGVFKKAGIYISYSFNPGKLEQWSGERQVGKHFGRPIDVARASYHNAPKYLIAEAVWGESYTDFFLNTHLPSLLAQGNLPALVADADGSYVVYTSSNDAEKIAANRFFKEAGRLVQTEIVTMDHLFRNDSYSVPISILLMTQCHRFAVKKAAMMDAALIFPAADTVISDGALRRVHEIALSGKRVVLTPGLRFCKETLAPALARRFADSNGVITADSRSLLKMAFGHLHPLMETSFIESDKFTKAPVNLFWPVDGEGLIAHCLHLHPLMIYPRNKNAVLHSAFDTDFLPNACPDYDDYHVVTDSDELLVMELSEKEKGAEQMSQGRFDLFPYAKFIKHRGNRIHHRQLRETIRIHHKDITPGWMEVEKKADRLVKTGLALKTFAYAMTPSTV